MSAKQRPPPVSELSQTIWTALDAWARILPPWQQYILEIAILRGMLSADEINMAFERFLRDKGLAPLSDGERAPAVVSASRPSAALAAKLLLTRVDSLVGINALPEGAALTFGPNLTVIYGRNGAGKSGFARLLANACFSRQRSPIISDIYATDRPSAPMAQFYISIGDAPQPPIAFTRDTPNSELQRITVFDAAVARHHITQMSAFEFKPTGFDVFPELVRVNNSLSEKLDQSIAKRTRANEFPQSFLGGGTVVHAAVAELGPATDLEPLRHLAKYGDAESARILELEGHILALRSQSPKEVLDALKEAAEDIRTLKSQFAALETHFTESVIAERKRIVTEVMEAVAVAAAAGSDQFRRPFFKAVGTPEWERFAASAHILARKEGEHYPVEADHCLLCERTFDDVSRKHVAALLTFVEGETRRTATEAQDLATAQAIFLEGLDINIFPTTSRVRTHVHKLSPELEPIIGAAWISLAAARDASVSDLRNLTKNCTSVHLSEVFANIDALAQRIAADVQRLEADNAETAIVSLECERRTLRHRHVLSQLLPAIEAFVVDSAWVARASSARSSLGTRHITEKEKELFGRVVGDEYRVRLNQECSELECNVPLELQTVGRSGQTMRSLAMKGGHKPEGILSEGEQRAVALADFLTEVSLNSAAAGIVFDDPVTSQDHQRKERIARRLTAEALSRQVIVFTHDLIFLNQLSVAADVAGCDIVGHWVDRTPDGRPGQIILGDTPITSRAYATTKRAEDAAVLARATSGTVRQDALRKGMGALRTTLEETVVRRVFKDIVPRWSDQVRVTTLRKVNWDNAKVEELCHLYEDLSWYIEGHSHTDDAAGAPVQVTDLEARIAQVKELIVWARADRPKLS